MRHSTTGQGGSFLNWPSALSRLAPGRLRSRLVASRRCAPPEFFLNKSELRKEFLEKRKMLDAHALTPALTQNILQALPEGVVAGYMTTRNEAPVENVLAALAARGVTTCLPCTDILSKKLTFRRWKPGDALVQGAYAILEPAKSAEAVTPDILLVPLLAFDRRGYRLGYGGGYYDRILKSLKPKLAVGVGFAAQEAPRIPEEAHDVRLDLIVTEAGIIHP